MPRREILIDDTPKPCSYLPGRTAVLPLWLQRRKLTPRQADEAFAAGERRIGPALYSPACPACTECRGIRVLAHELQPSRTQARAWRRWERLGRIEIGEPVATPERVALYRRHERMRGLALDGSSTMDVESYRDWLLRSCIDVVEMTYWVGERLAGVGIVDVGRTALSSVYFYFDPDPAIARLSPGVVSVLAEAELCRRTKRRHLYLGLYVRDCKALRYKALYYPHERLIDGAWRRFDGPEAEAAEPDEPEPEPG